MSKESRRELPQQTKKSSPQSLRPKTLLNPNAPSLPASNKNHKEDFNSLLHAAVKKRVRED